MTKIINKGATILKVLKCCTPVNRVMSEVLNCGHYFLSNPCDGGGNRDDGDDNDNDDNNNINNNNKRTIT